MQLCYIWIENYKAFQDQGVNLHPKYDFCYDKDTNQLTLEEKDDYLPLFEDNPVHQITGLIGKNGSGKSTVFELIMLLMEGASITPGDREIPKRIERLNESYLFVFHATSPLADLVLEQGGPDNLRLHCFQYEDEYFVVATNNVIPPETDQSLTPTREQGRGLTDFNQKVCCIYYNHTLEDASRKIFDGGRRFEFGRDQTLLTMTPNRGENGLTMMSVERDLAHGLIDLYTSPVFLAGMAKTFSRALWKPKIIRFKVAEWTQQTRDLYSSNLVEVMGLEDSSKADLFVDRYDRTNNVSSMIEANALGILGKLLEDSDPNRDIYWPQFRHIEAMVEGGGTRTEVIIEPILAQQTGLEHDVSVAFVKADRVLPCSLSLKEQLLRGLIFDRTFSKVIEKLKKAGAVEDDDTEVFITLDQLLEDNDLRDLLIHLPEWFELDLMDAKQGGKSLSSLSGGERQVLFILTQIDRILLHLFKARPGADVLLLMDEADLGLHPEWQRKILSLLHEGLGMEGQTIQLIYGTHSPFIASDLPHTHLTLMEKRDGQCRQITDKNRLKKTFGANIHSLLAESFFLDSTIGAFARTTMRQTFLFCHQVHEWYTQVHDPDLGLEGNEKTKAETKLKDALSAHAADSNDYRSRGRMWKLQAIMGESQLKSMLANHLAELRYIADKRGVALPKDPEGEA